MKNMWVICLFAAFALSAHGQELTPRAYWPAPRGTQVFTVGALYTDGDMVPDPSLPVIGIDSEISTGVFAYLRTMDLFGRTANLILEQTYSTGETSGVHDELGLIVRDYRGIGDFAATLSINLMGAPTMDKAGFAELRRQPRPILGASLKVLAPTGKYENDKIINVGANRWAAKAELGYITALTSKLLLEFEVGAWVFADNDDFLGMRRKQDPVYAAQVHLVRRFAPGFWASVDVNGYKGGHSEVDGRKLNDLQRDSKFGFTLAVPVARRHIIKGSWATGSVNDSDEDFDLFSLSYSRLF